MGAKRSWWGMKAIDFPWRRLRDWRNAFCDKFQNIEKDISHFCLCYFGDVDDIMRVNIIFVVKMFIFPENTLRSFNLIAFLLFYIQSYGPVYAQGVTESVYPAYVDSSGHVIVFLYPVELTDPMAITGIDHAVSVSGTIAIDREGRVWSWDEGIDPKGPSHPEKESFRAKYFKAQRVGTLIHAEQVSSTRLGSLIRLADGTVWGVGHTKFGQLDGVPIVSVASRTFEETPDRIIPASSPVQVPVPEFVVDISTSGPSTLALGKSGAIYAWGVNSYGALGGYSESVTKRIVANRIEGVGDVVRVYAGRFHGYAVTAAGQVIAWGGCPQANATKVVAQFVVDGIDEVKALSIPDFDEHDPVVFLRKDGSVWYGSINPLSYHDGNTCRLRSNSPYNAAFPLLPIPELVGKTVRALAESYDSSKLRILGLDGTGVFFSTFADQRQQHHRKNFK